MAFRFQQSQHQPLLDPLVVYKSTESLCIATALLLWFLIKLPQKGVSISTVPTSTLSRLPSHLEKHRKSLYCQLVLIDVNTLLLRFLIKLPQKGVSISTVPTLTSSRSPSGLQKHRKSLYCLVVLIDDTALFLLSVLKTPQNGVSFFRLFPIQFSGLHLLLFLTIAYCK